MKIPSPDALMVDLVDRALAVPQRKGIVLPRILEGFISASIGALVVEVAVSLALGMPFFAGAVACFAVAVGWGFSAQRRLYRAHGSAWGPDMAARYRSLALWHRQAMLPVRAFPLLGFTLFLAYRLPAMDWSQWPLILVAVGPILAFVGFLQLHQYGACAMPRDPDLRQESRHLAGLGA